VEGAFVTFVTDAPGGRGAMGKTDASGRVQLMTFVPGDGAVPGTYKVKISKTEFPEGASELPEDATEEDMAAAAGKEVLPPLYKDENTSGLTAEVKDTASNEFTFELSD